MNKIIGYSHIKESGAFETPKNPYHCVDCTSKRFTKEYIEKLPSSQVLTDADVESYCNYLKEFKQLPMKNIFCGTCEDKLS